MVFFCYIINERYRVRKNKHVADEAMDAIEKENSQFVFEEMDCG